MAVCGNCGAEHERWRDRAHTQPAWNCHACHAKYMRKTRPKHRDLPKQARRRANARAYANVYLRRGKIEKKPCKICGTEERVEMHHCDYSKPLEIEWFCRPCHLEIHRK